MKKQWAIGIDPGFGETGVVLRHGRDVKEFAVYSCRSGPPPFARAAALADRVIDILHQWVLRHRVLEVDIVIERPIWNKNPSTFELQWRLVQQIEAGLLFFMATEAKVWVTEISPTYSKKLGGGAGDASKVEVAANSPFKRADFPSDRTWTTLGDAWAHSLAAWGNEGTGLRLCYTDMKLSEVREYDAPTNS